jgi:poly(A) polymerase
VKVNRINKHTPKIVSRAEHGISRNNISENALKVLYRLNKSGYAAYLVGGAVRDLLLGRHPKDFDVATDASPEEVHRLFRNSRVIGRRFKIVHVRYGRDIIEVTTFRDCHDDAHSEIAHQASDGRLLRDNVFGEIDTDAWRRDLSVNALFYNIKDFSVVDYVNGMDDIAAKRLRVIGDPETRYREDPVRMLRVARFAAKLDFTADEATLAPIANMAPLLDDIPAARLYDEALKLFHKGHALRSFEVLQEFGLLGYLFLQVEECLQGDNSGYVKQFIRNGLANTDNRVNSGQTVNPAFLYAFLLWGVFREETANAGRQNMQSMIALGQDIFSAQVEQTAIPKRFSIQAREIWTLQSRFEQRRGKRPVRFLSHPRFRAAYDFLLLRNQSGEDLQELCDWWTEFQQQETDRKRRPRKRPRGKKRATTGPGAGQ